MMRAFSACDLSHADVVGQRVRCTGRRQNFAAPCILHRDAAAHPRDPVLQFLGVNT